MSEMVLTSARKIRLSLVAFCIGLTGSSIFYLVWYAGRGDLNVTGTWLFAVVFVILAFLSWLACGIPFAIKVRPDSPLLRLRYLALTSLGFAIAGYAIACVGFSLITQEFDPRMWFVVMLFGYEIFLVYALPISLIALPLYAYLLRRAVMRLEMTEH